MTCSHRNKICNMYFCLLSLYFYKPGKETTLQFPDEIFPLFLSSLAHDRRSKPHSDYSTVAPHFEQLGLYFNFFKGSAWHSCCILKLPLGKCWGNILRLIIPIFTQMLDCCVRVAGCCLRNRRYRGNNSSSGISVLLFLITCCFNKYKVIYFLTKKFLIGLLLIFQLDYRNSQI